MSNVNRVRRINFDYTHGPFVRAIKREKREKSRSDRLFAISPTLHANPIARDRALALTRVADINFAAHRRLRADARQPLI